MLGQLKEARTTYESGLQANERNADLAFYLAQRYYEDGNKAKALELLASAKANFLAGYGNSRPYVAEFYQVYLADIKGLEMDIVKTNYQPDQ